MNQCNMEPEASKTYNQSSHQRNQSIKLSESFMLDRIEQSHSEFHADIVRHAGSMPKNSQGLRQKKLVKQEADELVRYMSNLPSYLERGGKHHEKAFNVGVLEWRRLEKWQCNQQKLPRQSCRSSPSSSNASPFSSTEGSSSYSSQGQSSSPAHQRSYLASPQSDRCGSPGRVHGIKSCEKDGSKCHVQIGISNNYIKVQQSILSTHQSFNKYRETNSGECGRKHSDMKSVANQNSQDQDDLLEEAEKLRSPYSSDTDKHCRGRRLEVQSLQKEEGQGTINLTAPNESNTSKEHDKVAVGGNCQNVNDGLDSDGPHSCPLRREVDAISPPAIEQPISRKIMGSRYSSNMRNRSVSPVRWKITGKADSSERLKLKIGSEQDNGVRKPSPVRRFGFNMGLISRSCEGASSMAKSNHQTGIKGSQESGNQGNPVNLSAEQSGSSGKARSSPLRRLLDPLLRSRAGDSDQLASTSCRSSFPVVREHKLSNIHEEANALQSMKVKLDLGSCKRTDIEHPHDMGKCGSTIVQALLQVAVKNGLPLFTFAIDNSSDILAATVKRLNSRTKDGKRWIFTFFNVHETKRRNGNWLNYASKDTKIGYMPNVVGQMKVSDVIPTDLVADSSLNQYCIREFVLLAMNLRQKDEQTSDFQANSELAGIVIKLPKMTTWDLSEEVPRKHNEKNLSKVDPLKSSHKLCSSPEDSNIGGGGSSAGNNDLFSLTAILPGGDHGLPCKGKPSPLIERWRLGGTCDCGGWDIGCRLKVLTCQTQLSRTSSPEAAQFSTQKFNLYSQEQVSDRKPIFSLSPFKDDIYSVEYDSTLKLLQAFSICIAVLDGLKAAGFSDINTYFQKKSSEPFTSSSADGSRPSNRDVDNKLPASYVSRPPESPAGRV